VIDRNVRMQAQLVADLLDMSGILAGKMRVELERVDLRVVIEAALDSVRSGADAKGVTITHDGDAGDDSVTGDPARLQQIVWNLLSNAIKFTPAGGRVWVTTARSRSSVEITVRDTGKGITREFLPHVFERFRQADHFSAREHGGLGLGLAIVKQLVDLHGGSARPRVVATASADEALSALAEARPDVIVSDLGMPLRDGYAFMEAVRSQGVTVPAAAVIAFARPEDRAKALDAGYQAHIAKPVEPGELVWAVAALVQHSWRADRG